MEHTGGRFVDGGLWKTGRYTQRPGFVDGGLWKTRRYTQRPGFVDGSLWRTGRYTQRPGFVDGGSGGHVKDGGALPDEASFRRDRQ